MPSPSARATWRDTGIAISVDTLYRQRRVESALRSLPGKVSVDDLKQALSDRYGWPDSVLRPPKPAPFGAQSCTVCTTLMRPAKGQMEIARKPWIEQNFHPYSLA